MILAVDPGTEQSACVTMISDYVAGQILPNDVMLEYLSQHPFGPGGHLVIERIESFGMAVGKSVFETVFWSGRFVEAFRSNGSWSSIGRRDVKLALCGTARAKDANIRQALIDRYGGPSAIKKGGPLYGIKSHLWAALAVGVAYQEQQKAVNRGDTRSDSKKGGDLGNMAGRISDARSGVSE